MYRAMSRTVLLVVLLVLAIGWVGQGVHPSTHAAGLTVVEMEQAYIPDQAYLPYVTALDQGYYARNGIAFINHVGSGAGTSTKIVGAGTMPIGLGAASVVMQAIAVGVPITIIMTQDQQDATGVCALKSSGIKTAKDLEGKSIANAPGAAGQFEIILAMQHAGLDPSTIRWVSIAATEKSAALLAKRVDAATCPVNGSAVSLAQKAPINVITVASLGLHVPEETLFVNNSYLQGHRALVVAFVRATLEGMRYTVAHPAQAVAGLRKHYPDLDAGVVTKEWQITWASYERSTATDEYGLGWNDATRYHALTNLLIQGKQLTQPLDLSKVYTNSVLQAIPLAERKIP